MEQQTDTNLLADIEQDISLEPASVSIRFANFLIDSIFYYGIILLIGFVLIVVLESNGADIENSFLFREDPGSILLQYVVSLGSYLGMFTLLEGAAKGKTLGKLITGTRALRLNGEDLTWKDAFMRTLCRLVPFELFSAFGGNPWHDRWTDTLVIKERRK
jgi:uncharacterized RDD family membrane protein YckC